MRWPGENGDNTNRDSSVKGELMRHNGPIVSVKSEIGKLEVGQKSEVRGRRAAGILETEKPPESGRGGFRALSYS